MPFYKVNVDGAVFGKQKKTSVGVVIRDLEGNFIASLSKEYKAPLGAIEVEAGAFETGIRAFLLGAPNAKYLAFGTPNTIIQAS